MTNSNPPLKIQNLETLQQRKAELALQFKAKEEEISQQVDYIGDNIGAIAVQSFTGISIAKASTTKGEIINLLVAEGVDAALHLHNDPTNFREKLIEFVKKIAAGIIHILTK